MALSEFSWIETYLKPLATTFPALHLMDDAAIVPSAPEVSWVFSTDTAVEGIHFFSEAAPEDVAQKVFRSSLSDLAAMGAKPYGYLMNLARSRKIDEAWLQRFTRALAIEQDHYKIALWGGDTVTSPGPLMLSFTVIGTVPEGQGIKRSTAQVGDAIYVTGNIGDSALGLKILSGTLQGSEPACAYLKQRHFAPTLSFSLAEKMYPFVSAAIDISDGFVADLGHIATASGLEAIVEADLVPHSPIATAFLKAQPNLRETLLTGGEDYELIITVPPHSRDAFAQLAADVNVKVTCVGKMAKAQGKPGVILRWEGEVLQVACGGYEHF